MGEKISIIVPVYNAEKYLKKCVDSILAQTYKNVEVILVNDGSRDNSGEICKQYAKQDERVVYIEQENGGCYAAYCTGVRNATSEYLGAVDSDDWIEPDMFEVMMEKMLSDPEMDMVVCNLDWATNKNGQIVCQGKDECGLNSDCYVTKEKFFFNMGIPSISPNRMTKIYRKRIMDELIEKFDKSITYSEDIMLTSVYALLARKMYYVDRKFYHYYIENSDSMTSTINMQKWNDIEKIYNTWVASYDFSGEDLQLLKRNIMCCYTYYMYVVSKAKDSYRTKKKVYKQIIFSAEYKRFMTEDAVDEKNKVYLQPKKLYKKYKKRAFRGSLKRLAIKLGVLELYRKLKGKA